MKITITAEGFYGKVTGEFDFGEFDLTNHDLNTRDLAISCIEDVLNAAGIENDTEDEEESEVTA